MLRKVCSYMLVLALIISSAPIYAQEGLPRLGQDLERVEMALYGEVRSGAILPRIEQAERDVFGEVESGASSLPLRIQRLRQYAGDEVSGVSLILQLNAIEWMTFQETTSGESFVRRVDLVEQALFGEMRSEPLSERIADLARALWGSSRANVAKQKLPKEKTIRIRTLTEINSASMEVGDEVRYRVAETVIIDNNIVIPEGARGQGSVQSVSTSARLGRDGLVVVDWGTITAIDGTPIRVTIGEKATERNHHSAELAAGAALAGAILLGPVLGPIGLAAGAFVQGKEYVLPKGSEFYAEVKEDVEINAVSLVPQR